ncbi:glycoside hydrolase family 125 protein [Blautia liquoris]|nr:glycoside hydrolase family 125 protein [Blautia liquoris]
MIKIMNEEEGYFMPKAIPEILIKRSEALEKYYEKAYPKLAPMVKQCFLNAIETTVEKLYDGTYFVITGDIPAMWLRDSAAQVHHYIRYAKGDQVLDKIIRGVLKKQVSFVLLDPYANAFNSEDNGKGYKDETDQNPGVWERKYEVDSLCAPIYLAHAYLEETGESKIFDEDFLKMIKTILEVFRTEQDHAARSPYHFQRHNGVSTDTLPMEGKGNPVSPCGMTWSGFRPSDDSCTYGYLVPANMMAVKALDYAEEIINSFYDDSKTAGECRKLSDEINTGIQEHAVAEALGVGKIYAYETDGRENYLLMDDANSPSLLAIPYLGYTDTQDEMYQRTRKFVLSKENPYYYEGRYAKGIGSPHTPKGYIWCISIIMQALTSDDSEEILNCLEMLSRTHGETNYMHESFHPDKPEEYTRSWFAWANSLFGELLDRLMENDFFKINTDN